MVTYEFSLDDEFLLIKYSKPIDLVSDQKFCLFLSERKSNFVPCSGIFLQVSSFSVPPCKVSILFPFSGWESRNSLKLNNTCTCFLTL